MTKKGLNPAVFTITVIITAITAMNLSAQYYTERLYAYYDSRFASFENDMEKLAAETETLQNEATQYKNALKVKDMFADLAGGMYAPEDIMRYSVAIAEESSKYNIDPILIMAIIATESSFRDKAVSHKGAMGIMQLLPSTAFYISGKTGHINLKNAEELLEPETNLRLGVAYLAYLVKKTGSMEHAIIAYNYGPVNLKRALENKRGLPKKYMNTVMKNYGKMTASS